MARPVRIDPAQVLSWRLARHHLPDGGPDGGDAVEVVRRLAGVQAQVPSSAELAVLLRQARPDPGAVTAALADGRLVRTWAMRGTLHLLPGDVAGAYLALVAAGRTWTKGAWQRTFLPLAELELLTEAVTRALADGVPRTRQELVDHVREQTGTDRLADELGSSWGAVLKPLAWQGLLCQGPPAGRRVTFARPQDVAPGWTGLPAPEDAVRTVLPAYLAVHGPADLATFDAWLLRGATPKGRLRSWAEALGDALTTVEVGGRPVLARAEDVDDLASTRPADAVRLLGPFDQFVLGPGTADAQVVPHAHRSAVSRAAGWIAPVVVTAAGVVGTWTPDPDGGPPQVELLPGAPPPDEARLAAELERVATVARLQQAAGPAADEAAEPDS